MKRAFIALLVVLLVAAAYYYYYRRQASTHPASGPVPDLVMLAPPESTAILYTDVAALRASPLLSRLVALFPLPAEEKEYAEFVRATGFDYSRDLDRLVITLYDFTSDSKQQRGTVAIADGRFDREKIIHYAMRTGKKERISGRDVYRVPSDSSSQPNSFAFLNDGRLALADSARIPSTIFSSDARSTHIANSASPDSLSQFHERITRVSGAAFFAIARFDALSKTAARTDGSKRNDWFPSQLEEIFRGIRWFSAAAHPDGDSLKVALEGECDGALKAQQLSLLLEAFRALARSALKDPQSRRNLSPQQIAIFEHILQNTSISRDGNRVVLRFELTSALLAAPPSRQDSPRG